MTNQIVSFSPLLAMHLFVTNQNSSTTISEHQQSMVNQGTLKNGSIASLTADHTGFISGRIRGGLFANRRMIAAQFSISIMVVAVV